MKTKSVFLLSLLLTMFISFGCKDQIQPEVSSTLSLDELDAIEKQSSIFNSYLSSQVAINEFKLQAKLDLSSFSKNYVSKNFEGNEIKIGTSVIDKFETSNSVSRLNGNGANFSTAVASLVEELMKEIEDQSKILNETKNYEAEIVANKIQSIIQSFQARVGQSKNLTADEKIQLNTFCEIQKSTLAETVKFIYKFDNQSSSGGRTAFFSFIYKVINVIASVVSYAVQGAFYGAAIGAGICGPPCLVIGAKVGAAGGGLYGLAAGISDQFL
jgi:hypothetical protein